jgi:hypothetical protein
MQKIGICNLCEVHELHGAALFAPTFPYIDIGLWKIQNHFKTRMDLQMEKYMLPRKTHNHQGKLMGNIIGDSWEINCTNLAFSNNARLLPM